MLCPVMKPSTGGGLLGWLHARKKSLISFLHSRFMGDPASSIAGSSNNDSQLCEFQAQSGHSSSLALPATTLDAQLGTSKVRLLSRIELKKIISESLIEMGNRILLSANDGGVEKSNEGHAESSQQVLAIKQQKIKDLEMRLRESLQTQSMLQDEVEMLKPEQYVFTSGSFEEGAASPPMLQDAHDAMQSALLTCAVKVGAQVKPLLGRTHQKIFIRQLCDCFFIDFETASFGSTQKNPNSSSFQRPDKDLKRRLFQEYMDYRAENETKLFNEQSPLKAFCNSRFHLFLRNRHDRTPFKTLEDRKSRLEERIANEGSPLFVPFVRLAKTVWLLHKLAFAFEPTAEIFRVSEGIQYDPDYMEVRDHGDPESASERAAAEVGFMAAPGFTVRNFIIKAQVHLKE